MSKGLFGKSSRLSATGGYGIAVRTKWLSCDPSGCSSLKGNRSVGDDSADERESLHDLSRKLYHIHRPILY